MNHRLHSAQVIVRGVPTVGDAPAQPRQRRRGSGAGIPSDRLGPWCATLTRTMATVNRSAADSGPPRSGISRRCECRQRRGGAGLAASAAAMSRARFSAARRRRPQHYQGSRPGASMQRRLAIPVDRPAATAWRLCQAGPPPAPTAPPSRPPPRAATAAAAAAGRTRAACPPARPGACADTALTRRSPARSDKGVVGPVAQRRLRRVRQPSASRRRRLG